VCRIWTLVSNWLGFTTITRGNLLNHLLHFGGLGGFLKQVQLALKVIWFSMVCVILEERYKRLFSKQGGSFAKFI